MLRTFGDKHETFLGSPEIMQGMVAGSTTPRFHLAVKESMIPPETNKHSYENLVRIESAMVLTLTRN